MGREIHHAREAAKKFPAVHARRAHKLEMHCTLADHAAALQAHKIEAMSPKDLQVHLKGIQVGHKLPELPEQTKLALVSHFATRSQGFAVLALQDGSNKDVDDDTGDFAGG